MLHNPATVHAMERLPRRSFEKGAVIRQPDDLSETVLLIESGRAQCFYMTPQGSDAVLGELGAGDFIGDLQALDGGIPDACYEALERTSAILFRRDEFLERLRLSAPFAEAYTRRLCTRVRLLNQLYVESRVLPMRERLFAELIRLSLRTETGRIVIAPAPTHAELARRIASQRETVTKQMSALARSGIISLEGQTIISRSRAICRPRCATISATWPPARRVHRPRNVNFVTDRGPPPWHDDHRLASLVINLQK